MDLNQLIADLRTAAKGVLNKDIDVIQGFQKRQLEALAVQAKLVGDGIVSGQIRDETQEFFLAGLKDMARNLVDVLVGLAAVVAEKLWNALVRALWTAIGKAAGIVLPGMPKP